MQDHYCDMGDKVPPPVTVAQTCSVVAEMTGNRMMLRDSVEQEESSIMRDNLPNFNTVPMRFDQVICDTSVSGRSSAPAQESQKKESSEWTNEKHSLYLKAIEASFVDQLYNSSDVLNWRTQKNGSLDSNSTRKSHANARIPSGQFKVLQGGYWSKKNFRRENSQLNDANRPHVSPANPWVQHFGNGSRRRAVVLPSLHERPSSTAISLQYSHLCHQESGCSNTEVTDQNFVEEDTAAKKGNRPCSRKRMRTSVVGHSSNDQVVPIGTFPATGIADGYASPKK